MRKLKAYVHIKAPLQKVRQMADQNRREWLVSRGGMLLHTLSESWEATEAEGGTRFTLRMEYKGRLSFLEPLVADSLQSSMATSLGKLKQLAETHTN